ncbi:hypothetical protein [Pontitalea aquivivens]|uniref:hypothetical protein n=1 Tax=Pontitalea aquivivens TaxID=3388663 RepID=UPI0039706D8F
MTALKKPAIYRGEYAYRQGFALEEPLPEYLAELVDATHTGLKNDDTFSAVAEIDLGADLPKYRLVLDLTGMTLTIRANGEEEDTHRPLSMFEHFGGIRDILSGLVQGGGLPMEVDPNRVHIQLS